MEKTQAESVADLVRMAISCGAVGEVAGIAEGNADRASVIS
jgi:hypothetical protein